MFSNNCQSIVLNMFIYTEFHIESHNNTPKNNLQYKTHPKHQITFSKLQLGKMQMFKNWNFIS